jgi:hypothetical protein
MYACMVLSLSSRASAFPIYRAGSSICPDRRANCEPYPSIQQPYLLPKERILKRSSLSLSLSLAVINAINRASLACRPRGRLSARSTFSLCLSLQIDVRNRDSRRLIEPDAKTRGTRKGNRRGARGHFRCGSPSEQNGTETHGKASAEPEARNHRHVTAGQMFPTSFREIPPPSISSSKDRRQEEECCPGILAGPLPVRPSR